jgi:hypothetical protein
MHLGVGPYGWTVGGIIKIKFIIDQMALRWSFRT